MRRVVLALLVTAACPGGAPPAAKQRPAPLVVTRPVVAEDVRVLLRAPTDLKPVAQADVGSKAVGYLDAVLVERGDVVKKGQLLAVVRPSDLPDQLASAKSAVAQSEAARGLAKANLERAQALVAKGLTSQQELQAVTTSSATAEAQLAAAQSNLGALATRLGELRLEAPMDGVVVARRLDPGALVGPTTGSVLTVARVDRLRAFIAISESRAALLKVGQSARLHLDALGAAPVEARVERIAPAFDPVTRTLDAELHLANASGNLRPGMYGKAEVEVDVHRAVPVVPVEAVQLSDDKAFVFVVTGDAVTRRRITLGEDLGDRLEVRSGLAPGDELVVKGIDNLADGMKIRKTSGRPDAGPLAGPAAPPTR